MGIVSRAVSVVKKAITPTPKPQPLMSIPGQMNPLTKTMNAPLPSGNSLMSKPNILGNAPLPTPVNQPLMSVPGQLNPLTNTMNAPLPPPQSAPAKGISSALNSLGLQKVEPKQAGISPFGELTKGNIGGAINELGRRADESTGFNQPLINLPTGNPVYDENGNVVNSQSLSFGSAMVAGMGASPVALGKAYGTSKALMEAVGIGAAEKGMSQAASGLDPLIIAGKGKISQVTLDTIGYMTNTKTIALTESFISKIVASAGKPANIQKLITAGIISAIGSYPFSGWLKEESLQTYDFGYKTASEDKDVEGMDKALAMKAELLDPQIWRQIINSVPGVNLGSQLLNYYKSAALKLEIDTKHTNKVRAELVSPEQSQYLKDTQTALDMKKEQETQTTKEFQVSQNFYRQQRLADEQRKNEQIVSNQGNQNANDWALQEAYAQEAEKKRQFEAQQQAEYIAAQQANQAAYAKAQQDEQAAYAQQQAAAAANAEKNQKSRLKFGLLG